MEMTQALALKMLRNAEEASEPEPAKKPYPVGSKEAAEAVERVKQREAELEVERKATRRLGRKKKTAE
jgi:hypothetical protein